MKRTVIGVTAVLFVGWILVDLYWPRRIDLRQFDPAEVARLDAAMWRSYYDRKPLALFWQSAQLCRHQLSAPFWRSFVIAGHAAKAAFIFKDGRGRPDYARALPDLEAFYGAIAKLSNQPLNVPEAARDELEWWVIRRERDQYTPDEWAALQTRIVAGIYHVPVAQCTDYGRLRTEAMLLRDRKGKTITEADWTQVEQLLVQAWQALAICSRRE
ncbi:hypothetical protein ACAW74_18580 [Fibrella sp. WM1]|uniref:hypothetical protein n=1 Tax=Fibrella musci TaxID=3242485 RepID=UPI0035211E09